MATATLPPLVTPEDAAKALNTNTRTLANWRCTGRHKLPFVKIGGRVMYREDDLIAFIERGTVRPGEAS